jgi:ribosomal protein S18 acetylase RimI-like enzyme
VPWAGRAEDPDEPDVWAIVCFAIRPGFRRQGLTLPLTKAAVQYARAHPTTRRVVVRLELD